MRLPIKALRELAKQYKYSHVVAYAYDAQNNMAHIATYGKTIHDAGQAAQFGNMMKDALHWPESLHAEPNRVKRLQERIKADEEIGALMSNVFFNWSQQERFTPEERKMMKDFQEKWDVIPRR
jgi:hypothetical protein